MLRPIPVPTLLAVVVIAEDMLGVIVLDALTSGPWGAVAGSSVACGIHGAGGPMVNAPETDVGFATVPEGTGVWEPAAPGRVNRARLCGSMLILGVGVRAMSEMRQSVVGRLSHVGKWVRCFDQMLTSCAFDSFLTGWTESQRHDDLSINR